MRSARRKRALVVDRRATAGDLSATSSGQRTKRILIFVVLETGVPSAPRAGVNRAFVAQSRADAAKPCPVGASQAIAVATTRPVASIRRATSTTAASTVAALGNVHAFMGSFEGASSVVPAAKGASNQFSSSSGTALQSVGCSGGSGGMAGTPRFDDVVSVTTVCAFGAVVHPRAPPNQAMIAIAKAARISSDAITDS